MITARCIVADAVNWAQTSWSTVLLNAKTGQHEEAVGKRNSHC